MSRITEQHGEDTFFLFTNQYITLSSRLSTMSSHSTLEVILGGGRRCCIFVVRGKELLER